MLGGMGRTQKASSGWPGISRIDFGESSPQVIRPLRAQRGEKKSALDFSVQDASAALPQNCQTTRWILRTFSFRVNVTLVMELHSAKSLLVGLGIQIILRL